MNKEQKNTILYDIVHNLRYGSYIFVFDESNDFYVKYVPEEKVKAFSYYLIEKNGIKLTEVLNASITKKSIDSVDNDQSISFPIDYDHTKVFKELIMCNYVIPQYHGKFARKKVIYYDIL